jgi:zinc protease
VIRFGWSAAALAWLTLTAQSSPPAPSAQATAGASPQASWINAGSEVPDEPDWRTGTLPNGVRFAVRRNATPPQTVAIRVRIDAGALMERDEEQGWAHFLEHMVFRGTPKLKDGEAVRLWQRLGASFGSDSNAFTSLTQTTYKLDLPRADIPSVAQATGALADLLQNATVDPALVEIERKVILAERAQRLTPLVQKVQDANRALMQAGLLAEHRNVIGQTDTLAGASADGLRAFHRRWYRPERATVVLVGDADPAELERIVRDAFGGWKGTGAAPSEPAYGRPVQPANAARIVVDRLASASVTVGWITPHDTRAPTLERLRSDLIDTLALRVLSQRLSDLALTGGPLLAANVGLSRARWGADSLYLTVSPRGNTWDRALAAAYGVVNTMVKSPPSQVEIDQQVARMAESLRRSVATDATTFSSARADRVITAADTREPAGPRAFYVELFDATRKSMTPEAIRTALARLTAPEPRALFVSALPMPVGDASVARALTAARTAAGGEPAALRQVSLDELPSPGAPGRVMDSRRIDDLGIERVRFANGVELSMKRTDYARDTVLFEVKAGEGLSGRAPNDAGLGWSGSVLSASGVGPLTAPELTRAAAGRQIGVSIGYGSDGLTLTGATNPRDLADALRLAAAQMIAPRYDPVALGRTRDGYVATFRTLRSQPGSVFRQSGTAALYGGDERFAAVPKPASVAGTKIEDVRRFWDQALSAGRVRIAVVGDFDRDALVAAVGRTLGALPPRSQAPADPTAARLPPFATEPLILRHEGDADQALAVRAWRTSGPLADLPANRALSVAAAILETRLTEQFREVDGGSYSPNVSLGDARGFRDYGVLTASSQLRPGRIADFDAALSRAITDLATQGPDADELARARETVIRAAERTRAANGYWLAVLSRDLDDPQQIESIRTYLTGRRAVDAAAVRAVAQRFLQARPLRIDVLPKEATATN